MPNKDTPKSFSKENTPRVMIDIGSIYDELKIAMLEDALNHDTTIRSIQEYVREEVLRPFLQFRLMTKQNGEQVVPTLAQFLKSVA